MLKHFDHITVAVRDVDAAKDFFGHLGFELDKDVVVRGEEMERYMGVPGIEAEHVTLVLRGATPRTEVQLLCYRHPATPADPAIPNLARVGFNHICFTVDDMDAEVVRLKALGIPFRNEVMEFHDRKLVYLSGPEGITVELAEWLTATGNAA
jgi:catechol 2,3-dioxygenase-like lactoylglutathione lyase family enzyme